MAKNVTFTPLKDFFSEELNSQYCAGLSYTVRPVDTLLSVQVEKWLSEGKVRLGPQADALIDPAHEKAKLSGTGKVKSRRKT